MTPTSTEIMPGTIRVVSKRAGGLKANPDETVIPCDRRSPILGNRHILSNHRNPAEREQVIKNYAVDLGKDFAVKGPKFQACVALAARVRCGENIALECWCSVPPPKKFVPCHGHLLAVQISEMVVPKPMPT